MLMDHKITQLNRGRERLDSENRAPSGTGGETEALSNVRVAPLGIGLMVCAEQSTKAPLKARSGHVFGLEQIKTTRQRIFSMRWPMRGPGRHFAATLDGDHRLMRDNVSHM